MNRYRVTFALRNLNAPHIDLICWYRVDAHNAQQAITRARRLMLGDYESATFGNSIRRITVTMMRVVEP